MPFFETTKQKLIISVAFGISIMLFLFFFDQYPREETLGISLFKTFVYGFITFLVLFFYYYLFPIIFSKFFNIEYWNIGKSLLFGMILIISVGLVNTFFAFKFDNPYNNSKMLPFLFAVVYRTFIIGIIPTIIFHFWLENKLYKKYSEKAQKVDENIEKSINNNNDQELVLQTNNKSKNLILKTGDIIFVKSEGNYCQIYYKENSSYKKMIFRNTLKNLEKDFKDFDNILRCHKSYIINLDKVLHVKGNARGYYFIVDGFNYSIPVSRELSKNLLKAIT